MKNPHGLISLLLLVISIIFGSLVVLSKSTFLGFVYLLILVISFPVIIYSFCSKSPCRYNNCGHILPGLLTKILPKRQTKEYTKLDWIGVLIPSLIIVLYPQYWLWGNKLYLLFFWLPILIGVYDIKRCVCPKCVNNYCPLKK